MTDTTTEAVERLATYFDRNVAALDPIATQSRGYDAADTLRALAAERDALTARVAELEAENARMRAEGLREAAGLIKPPKFCLPDQVGRVEAMHEMRHAILARADEIERGEG
jgi:PHD/YefM family antitoxin component YafN of YafNO toxin-antitoxin module